MDYGDGGGGDGGDGGGDDGGGGGDGGGSLFFSILECGTVGLSHPTPRWPK